MTRTSVILDPKVLMLAEAKHDRIFHQKLNVSEFCRLCLESWATSPDDPRPLWQQASDIVEQIKKERAAQQELIRFASKEEQDRAASDKARRAIIATAISGEMERHGRERFRRYIEDPNGDYHRIQDDILQAMSRETGFAVELSDVMEIMRKIPAGEQA